MAIRNSCVRLNIALLVITLAGCNHDPNNKLGGTGETATIVVPTATEQWNGWENLNGSTNSPAECVATQTNRIDCFARTYGAGVTRTQWDGQRWTGPTELGGIAMDSFYDSAAECPTWAPDHIDCLVRRDSDKVAFRRTIHGSFMTGWEWLGGSLSSDPDCVTRAAERLDCFARGDAGDLMRNSFDGNLWTGWSSQGGQIRDRTKPACVVFRGDILCAVVTPAATLREFRFTANGLVQRDMQGGELASPIPGISESPKCYVSRDPDLNSNADDQVHCFAPRFGLLARWILSGTNANWALSDIGGAIGGDWDCVVRSSGRIDCVELIRSAGTGQPPTPPTSFSLRHRVLETGQSVRMSTVALTPPAGVPTFIRCVSWAADRIDCFASGSVQQASPLLHAWLGPAPERPGVYRPAGGS